MPPRTGNRRVPARAPKPSLPDASDDDDSEEPSASDSSLEIVGNDPDAIPTKARNTADDVNYFYDKTVPGDLVYCKECR